MSERLRGIQSKKPFEAAERIPLTLAVVSRSMRWR